MNKCIGFVIVMVLAQSVLLAQDILPCGNLLSKALLSSQHEQYETLVEQAYQDAASSQVEFRDGDTLIIPVVIHVIHNTPQQNISDELIQGQLDVLNEDFLRTNADAALTRDIFLEVAGTPNIQFALASIDPDGNATDGITRTETTVESFINIDISLILEAFAVCGFDVDCIAEYLGDTGLDLDLMKSSATGGVDPWDVNSYLNIWVCNLSLDVGTGPTPFILGFAYPPVGAPNFPTEGLPENYWEKDGVVIHWEAFGKDNPNAGLLAGTNDSGRTCTHEVGHYLGLRHIWGDGDCTMDDGLTDTPSAGSNSQSQEAGSVPTCESLHTKDSCVDDMLPDMIENYMDYSIESCQNMFTVEQSNLMRAMLEGPRAGLLNGGLTNTNEEDVVQQHIKIPSLINNTLAITGLSDNHAVYLFDMQGNLVLSRQAVSGDEISVSHLASGQYVVRVVKGQTLAGVGRTFKL